MPRSSGAWSPPAQRPAGSPRRKSIRFAGARRKRRVYRTESTRRVEWSAWLGVLVMSWGLVIVFAVAALLPLWLILTFNRLIRQRQRLGEAWSGIDVQLKRRFDLIPNLVETVQGYKIYERDLLSRVTELRGESVRSDSREQRGRIEGQLAGVVLRIFALAEAYPDLKADRIFLDLQKQLVEVEATLQMARRYYNGTVRDQNVLVESVPSNLVAAMFGFKRAEYFQLDSDAERATPSARTA